jgi:hypothetical protein
MVAAAPRRDLCQFFRRPIDDRAANGPRQADRRTYNRSRDQRERKFNERTQYFWISGWRKSLFEKHVRRNIGQAQARNEPNFGGRSDVVALCLNVAVESGDGTSGSAVAAIANLPNEPKFGLLQFAVNLYSEYEFGESSFLATHTNEPKSGPLSYMNARLPGGPCRWGEKG